MTASLTARSVPLPMAWLGPPCPMPRYRWQQPIPPSDAPPVGLREDEAAHLFNWGADSILPYQVQDRYDRRLRDAAIEVLELENDRFRARIAPGLGGRLTSLFDKAQGRELLFANPVFRPANLAALNAWFSGGVEWNGLTPGHSPTTCSPVFAARVDTERGPLLRLYEFDRTTECVWQIDLFLPPGDGPLAIHGRIVNPNDTPALVYWWTNIAVATPPGGRVLSPCDDAIEHVLPDNHLERMAFPRSPDGSYPGNWRGAASVFFRAGRAVRNVIACVDDTGRGLAHIGSAVLTGRKFFYFGTAPGGQHWMDYLSQPGQGDYVEIQAGITPHQNQRLPLGAGQALDWTAVLAPVQVPGAQDPDYRRATDALESVLPEAGDLAGLDGFLGAAARLPAAEMLSSGGPWGRRHQALTGRVLAENLDFGTSHPADFWDDLAQGRAPRAGLPDGFALSPLWQDRLRGLGDDWRALLFLSIAALDRGDRDQGAALARASLAGCDHWLSHRQLALSEPAQATAHYLAAWAAGGAPDSLAVEIADHLRRHDPAALARFIAALPAEVQDHERIHLARAHVAAQAGDADLLADLLTREFATIREGETVTQDLWHTLVALRGQALRDNPLPPHLDFRMVADDHTEETANGAR
ncbi:MAG: DUF5107 domain-containing protein [Paracoccus sp. (in: a-proteobacteria)]|uniref:DUF5107 domain-containing protein n=1 Tax=Paracoccus sp. TaxID=267 RepID=UPI0026DFF19F|nr:DUF5107 domain-containing protein [Paracoccus sp. (in: a-proteobacteria)]MDO5612312.1 DUF5107 domain-containing protein [Paracoccus sp. (in: a-proteobacteria)]